MSTARPTVKNLEIRRTTRADDPGVLALMRASLGWGDDERYEALFEWKHRQNPFGESPGWAALHEGRIVGFRTFMRWEFLDDDGQVLTAVRAVDTATDPEFRGMGVFRALTMRGVEELTAEGVGFVFNTPNDHSRPGYLKMGWQEVGRVPIAVMPSGPRGLAHMLTARVPAERWSIPTDVGAEADQALRDDSLTDLLLTYSPGSGLRTRRTVDYLRWRTSLGLLRYRLLVDDPAEPARGALLIRLRRRGQAVEAVIVEAFVPRSRDVLPLSRRMLRATGADYALATDMGAGHGLLPLPRQGPCLTTRALARPADLPGRWQLSLGDVELF